MVHPSPRSHSHPPRRVKSQRRQRVKSHRRRYSRSLRGGVLGARGAPPPLSPQKSELRDIGVQYRNAAAKILAYDVSRYANQSVGDREICYAISQLSGARVRYEFFAGRNPEFVRDPRNRVLAFLSEFREFEGRNAAKLQYLAQRCKPFRLTDHLGDDDAKRPRYE